MNRRCRLLRFAAWGGGVGVLISLIVFGGLSWGMRRSLPEWSGTRRVEGIGSQVVLSRGPYAVPYIAASSVEDAYFGLGYVHAQDRLWQMDLSRRAASGRLAEVLGQPALANDRLFRVLDLRAVAAKNLEGLSDATRAGLESYARGINAWLSLGRPLPPEYLLFQVVPEPWQPVDSVLQLKLMAWILAGNFRQELFHWRLAGQLNKRQYQEFLVPYPGEPARPYPTLPVSQPRSLGSLFKRRRRMALAFLAEQWPPVSEAQGSNAWLVAAKHSASGQPLLANDPHLRLTAPCTWYLAHLKTPGLEWVGATMPGVPGVLLGHNGRVAWGLTNTGSDAQDLLLEELAPGRPNRVLAQKAPGALLTSDQTIEVRGQDSVAVVVRRSQHGPILSDAVPRAAELLPEGQVLSLGWTGLDSRDTTLDFVLGAASAQSVQEMHELARAIVAPQQNLLFADVNGNTGFVTAGAAPLRLVPGLGAFPRVGNGVSEPEGSTLPFEALPRSSNPASGVIVHANQKILPAGYPYFFGADWAYPYRARRIEQLLEKRAQHTMDTFAAIQLDDTSAAAQSLLPLLLQQLNRALRGEPEAILTEDQQQARALLKQWDWTMAIERPEPLIFSHWLKLFSRTLYEDELGPIFESSFRPRVPFVHDVLKPDGLSHWCDNIRTSNRTEKCSELVLQSFSQAVQELAGQYGSSVSQWQWGQAHSAHSVHWPLGKVPVLRNWFDVRIASAGDAQSVNVGAYSYASRGPHFENRHGPGFRALYDLAALGTSRFVLSTGQSGHVLSPHYRDQAELWARGGYLSIPPGQPLSALGTMTLLPSRQLAVKSEPTDR